jgi:uncharacterized radical SAM protein YgiQ
MDADGFLPVSRAGMENRLWSECDFVMVTGDAYVDHPSFGAAVIARVLEAEGYRVCVLAQPDPASVDSFSEFGRPRLAFLVTSGNMDGMVNRYTANRRPRSRDEYSPGGKTGLRPDKAVIAYCNGIRRTFKGVAIVIGGIEASLRRLSHYDYLSDTVRRSILLDSKADILVYGMGERAITEIAARLASGEDVRSIDDIRGTCARTSAVGPGGPTITLPSFERVSTENRIFAESFMTRYRNSDPFSAARLVEADGERFVVQNPPAFPLSTAALDRIYELPYMRSWHPRYDADGGIPAFAEVEFGLVSSRGCFGGCAFCAIGLHEGRIVVPRSRESLVREAVLLSRQKEFKGYIHDVGGPTANFRNPACAKQTASGACPDRECLDPEPCPNLVVSHGDYLDTLRAIRALPGIKKVFIRSGLRFDYLLMEKDDAALREICAYHVSGQLKVAPEHVSKRTLGAMGKSSSSRYPEFAAEFRRVNAELGKEQYLLPYFISAHPGSDLADAIELAEFLRDEGFLPDQVQDFYPTPGTMSTCMYRTGLDPRTMESVHVARGERERRLQRALLQYDKPGNRALVKEALAEAGRMDLIGYGPQALIKPQKKGQETK